MDHLGFRVLRGKKLWMQQEDQQLKNLQLFSELMPCLIYEETEYHP